MSIAEERRSKKQLSSQGHTSHNKIYRVVVEAVLRCLKRRIVQNRRAAQILCEIAFNLGVVIRNNFIFHCGWQGVEPEPMETVKALRSQRASDCKRNECGNVKNENRKKREDYYGVFRQIYHIVYRDDVQSSFLSLWTSFVATQVHIIVKLLIKDNTKLASVSIEN